MSADSLPEPSEEADAWPVFVASSLVGLVSLGFGLVGFTLLLALVQSAFWETLEANVRNGSSVYEKGHTILLGFDGPPNELFAVIRQLCLAYKGERRAVVVLTSKDKIEMEKRLRTAVPDRHGVPVVFRQGTPLNPEHLEEINCTCASTIHVLADEGSTPTASDSLVLRALVQLEDRNAKGDQFKGYASVVAEFKTERMARIAEEQGSGAISIVRTSLRAADIVRRVFDNPVVLPLSRQVNSFESPSRTYLHTVERGTEWERLAGKTFSDLLRYFRSAIPLGLLKCTPQQKRCGFINPPADTTVAVGDKVLMLRRTDHREFVPLENPWPRPGSLGDGGTVATSHGSSYNTWLANKQSGSIDFYVDEGNLAPLAAFSGAEMDLLMSEAAGKSDRPVCLLIVGWREDLMSDLLRSLDREGVLGRGSVVTLVHQSGASIESLRQRVRPERLSLAEVRSDPMEISEIVESIEPWSYDRILVLCDDSWFSPTPEENSRQAFLDPEALSRDNLRLDSLALSVRLQLRSSIDKSATRQGPGPVVITESRSEVGQTRFEDVLRPPLGFSINLSTNLASYVSSVIYDPDLQQCLGSTIREQTGEVRCRPKKAFLPSVLFSFSFAYFLKIHLLEAGIYPRCRSFRPFRTGTFVGFERI